MKKYVLIIILLLIPGFVLAMDGGGGGGGGSVSEGGGGGGSSSSSSGGPVEPACIEEGEKGDIFNNDSCCEGLVKVANAFKTDSGCVAPNDGSFLCTDCGDGICGEGENQCNCDDCCKEGETKKYICPDDSEVQWCVCSENVWTCVESPENACPTPVEEEQVCPEGCICNNDVVVCSSDKGTATEVPETEETEAVKICPVGCVCTNEATVCNVNETKIENGCIMGCKLNEACVLPGTKTSVNGKRYCDIDSQWKKQKAGDEVCDNNYECETNLCIDGKCLSKGMWKKITEWFGNLLGNIIKH